MAYSNTKKKVQEAFIDEIEINDGVLSVDHNAPEEHKKGCKKCGKKNKNKSKKNKKTNGKLSK